MNFLIFLGGRGRSTCLVSWSPIAYHPWSWRFDFSDRAVPIQVLFARALPPKYLDAPTICVALADDRSLASLHMSHSIVASHGLRS
jgi:hypothetical protein